MNRLGASLNRLFKPAAPRKPDTGRKHREWAKPVAKEYGIEIEPIDGGFNVWPPKGLDDALDPHNGDHYAQDWAEVASMVKDYAHIVGSPA